MDAVPFLADVARRWPTSVTHDDSGALSFATALPGVAVRAVVDEKRRCVHLLCPLGLMRNIGDASLARRLLKFNERALEGEPYFSVIGTNQALCIGADLPINATPDEAEQSLALLVSRAVQEREGVLNDLMFSQ